MDNDERPRGILTKADREYLRNPDEYTRQARHERRKNIEKRIANSMGDFELLAGELDDEILIRLRENLLSYAKGESDYYEGAPPADVVVGDGFAFLARLSLIMHDQKTPIDTETALKPVSSNIEDGIRVLLNKQYNLIADVNVSIETTDVKPVESYREQLEEQELTPGEERLAYLQLLRAGFSSDEIEEKIGLPSPIDWDEFKKGMDEAKSDE